jgi:hypothetical protein
MVGAESRRKKVKLLQGDCKAVFSCNDNNVFGGGDLAKLGLNG